VSQAGVVARLFLISPPPDPAAYARNCQLQLDMMFGMLSDLVEYLSGEQDPFTGGLVARMFILRDFRDEVVDAPINLSWNYLILHQLIFERDNIRRFVDCIGSRTKPNDPTKCQQRLVTTFQSPWRTM
jgi:hypothetical protein